MVNKNNNKVSNYINIVNDLKGLGLLKRKRRRQSTEQTGKVIINPNRQLTGIERTIIDNSPMLRRDIQQIANERSVLEDRVKQNDAHLNYLYNELDSGRIFNRFMQENQNMGSPSGSLSNVKTNSLVLPSMNQHYDEEQKLNNDSIDVPVIDATESMIAQKDEPEKETAPQTPVKETKPDEAIESTLQPKVLFEDIHKEEDKETPQTFTNPLLQTRKKTRNTSPKPTPTKTPTQANDLLSPVSSSTQKLFEQRKINDEKRADYVNKLKDKTIPYDEVQTITQKRLQESEIEQAKFKQLQEEVQKAKDEKKRKQDLNQKRKEQEALLKEMKLKEMQTMEELAKERKIQDEQTELLTEKFFKDLGGKDYVIKNYAKDLDELYQFSKTNKLLNTSNNKELTEKYVKYLNLSGVQNSSKIAGRGYSSTNILMNIEKIKQGIKRRFRIYDPSTRSVSAMPRITMMKTMKDLERTKSPVDTNTKASSKNTVI